MSVDGLEPVSAGTRPAAPAPGGIEAWAICLDLDLDARARMAGLLSADEITRAARYRRPADRERFIAGRAQLRQILGQRLEEDAASLQFDYSTSGKPSLAAGRHSTQPHFNASGSDGLGLVVLRIGADVGVDIERRRAMPDIDRLAARLFAADEWAEFLRLPPAERESRFFDAWVRREALAKSLGAGLLALSLGEQTVAQWVSALALPVDGYAAAIASTRPLGDLSVRWWSPTP